MKTRDFHIGDILSITTGRLLSPTLIDGVSEILSFMAGESVFTHQLPRVADECKPELLRQYPQFKGVEVPDLSGEAEVSAWVAGNAKRFGEHLPVMPMAGDDHRRIDPVTELEAMTGKGKVIVVETQ